LHLRALGAEVVTTRSDVVKGHPDYYQDLAERLARESGAFYVNQFANPANPLAHETGTGPEIARQMEGRLDALVCGVGSGGTLTGLSRFFARALPDCEMVLADPEGSVLAGYVRTGRIGVAGSWLVEGIGEDFLPPICDLSRVRRAYSISDAESFQVARQLLLHTGILAGSSSGTLLAAALRYCREQPEPRRVCTLVCDTGNKYLSKMYDPGWLEAQGLAAAAPGATSDLLAGSGRPGGARWLRPADTLREAALRLRRLGLSALPVAEGGHILGVVTESHVLEAVLGGGAALDRPATDVMASEFGTVSPRMPLRELVPLLEASDVAIVAEGVELLGVVTRLDVLEHLRAARS
jgi:cystathionine beta-synthase